LFTLKFLKTISLLEIQDICEYHHNTGKKCTPHSKVDSSLVLSTKNVFLVLKLCIFKNSICLHIPSVSLYSATYDYILKIVGYFSAF
jgi:hypothetical protein